jgi:peptidoglycan/xylan/chitin deacetylase (PgdA/CDA1 family)
LAITFDDGYLDNLENALPRLATRNMPATLFIVSETVGQDREFWWDEVEGLVLALGSLPEVVRLGTSKGLFERVIGQAKAYSAADRAADAGSNVFDAAPGTRLHSFFEIWDFLGGLDSEERRRTLDALWTWAGRVRVTRQGYRPMNADELRAAATSSLVEIGAHTISHPRLPTLGSDAQRQEIIGGAESLERTLGARPRSFSFPFGQRDPDSLAIVREAFDRAVLTRPGVITANTPPHQLNRLPVEDWPLDVFKARLRKFLAPASP